MIALYDGPMLALCGLLGHLEDALADFTAATDLGPANIVALNNLGIMQRLLGDLGAADASFQRAGAVASLICVLLNLLFSVIRTLYH